MTEGLFLPGVDVARATAALDAAGGNEIASGKLASPESSAALAVNTFGFFLAEPSLLPPLPNLSDLGWPAIRLDVERCLRFPWSGGRHPWLDAVVETRTDLIGVESKRFEPFRDQKKVTLSAAYDQPVWGDGMQPFEQMRDALRAGLRYCHLDAAQLVKHAFGIVTQAIKLAKSPTLFYIYAEPSSRGNKVIPPEDIQRHRREIADFADRTSGASVRFAASSYRDYLGTFTGSAAGHAAAIVSRFAP